MKSRIAPFDYYIEAFYTYKLQICDLGVADEIKLAYRFGSSSSVTGYEHDDDVPLYSMVRISDRFDSSRLRLSAGIGFRVAR